MLDITNIWDSAGDTLVYMVIPNVMRSQPTVQSWAWYHRKYRKYREMTIARSLSRSITGNDCTLLN